MSEVVNLRKARKRAGKEEGARRAAVNRIVHGRSKAERALEKARAQQTRRLLDAHKIGSGDAR